MQQDRSAQTLIKQDRRLESAVPNPCLDILPVANQLNVGVIKQQPLLELFTKGVNLVMVPEVADDALQEETSM